MTLAVAILLALNFIVVFWQGQSGTDSLACFVILTAMFWALFTVVLP